MMETIITEVIMDMNIIGMTMAATIRWTNITKVSITKKVKSVNINQMNTSLENPSFGGFFYITL